MLPHPAPLEVGNVLTILYKSDMSRSIVLVQNDEPIEHGIVNRSIRESGVDLWDVLGTGGDKHDDVGLLNGGDEVYGRV